MTWYSLYSQYLLLGLDLHCQALCEGEQVDEGVWRDQTAGVGQELCAREVYVSGKSPHCF